jgi:hypothetical protein
MLNPTLGRFMQQDPMGYVDGVNDYQTEADNPINRRDPMGLYVQEVTIGNTVYFHVYKQNWWISTLFGSPGEEFVHTFAASVGDDVGIEQARYTASRVDAGGAINTTTTGALSTGKAIVAVAGMAIPGPEELFSYGILAKVGPRAVRVFWKVGAGWVTSTGEKVAADAVIGECAQATKGIIKVLAEKGIKGQKIAMQALDGAGHIANIPLYTDEFGTVATNGYHEAVEMEGLVYDNLHPQGIPYAEWKKKFLVQGGYTIQETRAVVP